MFRMLTCFKLTPGIGPEEFGAALDSVSAHLQDIDLVVGASGVKHRRAESHLDTDGAHNHEFFFAMDFREKAQSEAAFD